MKFLVHWKMRPSPDEEVSKLLPKDLEYCKKLMKEGKLLASYVLVGRAEGYELFEADSHEWLHGIIMNAPFGPFLDFEILPVVGFEFSLNTLKATLEKRKHI